MSIHASGSCRRFTAALAAAGLALGCEGDESGRDWPPPPCASDGVDSSSALLMRGRVTALADGCVTLAVDATLGGASIASADGTVLLEPADVGAGDVIHARLGQVYAYAHQFGVDDEVAILAGTWGQLLSFELMPWVDGSVRVQWTGREFDATPSDLLAPDCAERVQRLADDTGTDLASGGRDTTDVEPAAPPPSCVAP